MRETTEMWKQEKERHRQRERREGKRVEILEVFFVFFLSLTPMGTLAFYIYKKQQRHHLTYFLKTDNPALIRFDAVADYEEIFL